MICQAIEKKKYNIFLFFNCLAYHQGCAYILHILLFEPIYYTYIYAHLHIHIYARTCIMCLQTVTVYVISLPHNKHSLAVRMSAVLYSNSRINDILVPRRRYHMFDYIFLFLSFSSPTSFNQMSILVVTITSPHNAEFIMYKLWRPKGFERFKIIINVLVSSF